VRPSVRLRLIGTPGSAEDEARWRSLAQELAPADAISIEPDLSTVIVEGNYLLLDSGGWEAVRPLLDISFFVELEPSMRRSRLIARHQKFGKSPADAAAWTLGPDESNALLVAATAARANHVIAL